MTAVELLTKVCSKCGKTKSQTEYSPHNNTKDRLYTQCKPCVAKKTRAWQANKRAEIGETAWKARQTAAVQRSRAAGNTTDKEQRKAYVSAQRRLREAHRTEFDQLYREERYAQGLPV